MQTGHDLQIERTWSGDYEVINHAEHASLDQLEIHTELEREGDRWIRRKHGLPVAIDRIIEIIEIKELPIFTCKTKELRQATVINRNLIRSWNLGEPGPLRENLIEFHCDDCKCSSLCDFNHRFRRLKAEGSRPGNLSTGEKLAIGDVNFNCLRRIDLSQKINTEKFNAGLPEGDGSL